MNHLPCHPMDADPMFTVLEGIVLWPCPGGLTGGRSGHLLSPKLPCGRQYASRTEKAHEGLPLGSATNSLGRYGSGPDRTPLFWTSLASCDKRVVLDLQYLRLCLARPGQWVKGWPGWPHLATHDSGHLDLFCVLAFCSFHLRKGICCFENMVAKPPKQRMSKAPTCWESLQACSAEKLISRAKDPSQRLEQMWWRRGNIP